MELLSEKDVRLVLDVVRTLYESANVEGFASHAARALRRVVAADRCSYNEFYAKPGRFRSWIDPDGADLGGQLGEALGLYGHENPLLAYYRQTRSPEVCTFSDFIAPRQYHRLAIYNEYYKHVEVEKQIIVPLSLTPGPLREVGFALSRRRGDFSERDRQMLEILQPHLVQAYANARVVERLQNRISYLESGLEASGRAVIVLSANGVVLMSTPRCGAIFRHYFASPSTDHLPEPLARWVSQQKRSILSESALRAPRKPLIIERDGTQLTVTLVSNQDNQLLLFEERADRIDPKMLAPLGLTDRQGEILAWVALGKTNDEIARISGARPATVAKHLERIYQKLGVETRTAAAMEALDIAGRWMPRGV